MAKYKTKPVEIEAIEWTGTNDEEICDQFAVGHAGIDHNGLYISTLEGIMRASVGDFIIKGLRGEFYPCKPDVFHKKYEMMVW